ncbi:MAG: IS4 family transposase [Xenococcaceae cyanobacterium]
MNWAEEELSKANLGDKRRNKRLVKIVEDLAAQPNESVPQASRDNAAMQGIYEFWANRRIEAAGIIAAHTEATIERIKEHQVVLAIQDKTELDLGQRKRTKGIGGISNQSAQGIQVHNVLAVSEEGVPLGLLEQKDWVREKARKRKGFKERKRKIEEKESQRWLESLETVETLIPPEIDVITVADREADIYGLLAQPRRKGSHLLIRAAQNRRVKKGNGEIDKLFETVVQVEPCGQKTLELQRTPRRKARKARLTVRFTTVELQPPQGSQSSQSQPGIKVQAILAEEENPPPKEKAISWLLLTTLPVSNYQEACDCLEKYAYRWLIERYHFVLKSGCRVEELQLETEERMEKALATYSIVAWRLLWLTYEARKNPEKIIDEVLEEQEWQVLYLATQKQKQKQIPMVIPTLREGVRQIASKGGFLGRKGDGEPGVKTLWRGWQRLEDMVIGWQLSQKKIKGESI